jgi:hypothetical protein
MANNKASVLFLWLSRVIGVVALLFFLGFFIGEGIHDISAGLFKPDIHLAVFMLYLLLNIAGFVLSFIKRTIGGLLMLAAALLMSVFFITTGDYLMILVYGLPFFISGGTAVAIRKTN